MDSPLYLPGFATSYRTETASYLTRRALAAELMISEGTLDDCVRRGLLPPLIRISPNCLR